MNDSNNINSTSSFLFYKADPFRGVVLAIIPILILVAVVGVSILQGIDFQLLIFSIFPILFAFLLLIPAYLMIDPGPLNSRKLKPRHVWLYCMLPSLMMILFHHINFLYLFARIYPHDQPENYPPGHYDEYIREMDGQGFVFFFLLLFSFFFIIILFQWIMSALSFSEFIKESRDWEKV